MRTIFSITLCLSVACLIFWSPRKPWVASPAAPIGNAPEVSSSVLPMPKASQAERTAAASDLRLRAPADLLWKETPAEPAFASFQEWANRYMSAPEAEKRGLEAEGTELARARLAVMAELIQKNPERALELAVPFSVRASTPDSVKALLEEWINTRADYKVIGVLGLAGEKSALPPVFRAAQIDGEEYRIFTYGPALGYMTKGNAPLNGIAVPASVAPAQPVNSPLRADKLMALDPNPARQLEPAEAVAALQKEPFCSRSGQPTAVVVQLGGLQKAFCHIAHAESWVNLSVAAAGLSSPSYATDTLPIAESSYTEGRKRFLLMRPGFTDLTNTMPDSQVLSHFLNFSNYMFELSYGKLLFAGLGQGSDYTPIMRLPAVASTFDNNALGSGGLYDTCKAVAQTNYGFNISQYDFLYVVTAGASPAYSYAGLGFVGGVGFHLANGYFSQGTASHEYGHNLGLNHANFWSTGARSIIGAGSSIEYGDSNDPMGGASGEPEHYNSRYKNYLNWIHDTDIASVTSSGLFRLYAFDGVDLPGGLRGLKFIKTSGSNYWVHFRQRYTTKSMANGVQLLWTGNDNRQSDLLDVRLKDTASDSALVIGRTFSDTSLGMHITPIGKGNTYPESIDVMMNVGSFPGNLPPSVAVSASSTNAAAGSTITFSAAATDPNNDTLAYWWDFGDGDYSIDNRPTTTHSFAGTGEFLVQCTVSDMKGGVGRDSLIMRVGNPATFRISGRVFDQFNRPLSGIKVSADATHTALSDSDGTYTIVGLSAGNYAMDALEPVANAFSLAHPFFVNPVTLGPSAANKDFLVGTSAPPITLVATGAVWKYLDNGSDQGTAWIAPEFDDSTWVSGPAQLGYGEGDEATVISYGPNANNKYTTSYFRRAFNVTDASTLTNVVVSLLRDDGGIVYLNGVEVFRSNMPNGPVTYTTFAATVAADDGKTWFMTNVNPALLLTGSNVLAVEIHQSDLTSSDVSFDLSLTTDSTTNLSKGSFVYISSPVNGDSFASPTNIAVNATAMSTLGTITNVDFFDGANNLGAAPIAPYSSSLDNPSSGAHILKAVATLSSGIRITSAPVNIQIFVPLDPPVSISLIETGSVWRFYASNAAPSGSWTTVLYNDNAWPSGPAKLGYGQGDEATVIPYGADPNNKWITSYYRQLFFISDPSGMTNLFLEIKRDDGAVVYLNGVEILRNNMPSGTVSWGTLAATTAADNGQVFFSFNLDPGGLLIGKNVLAVEVHQAAANSSDVGFDLALTAQGVTNRSRGVWLTAPPDGAIIPQSTSLTLSAQTVVGGTLGLIGIQYYADGVKIGQSTVPPYSFSWVNPPGGAHELIAVTVDSAHANITSAPVNITITGPPLEKAIISFGDVWKYLDDGSNQGTNWVGRTFDDRMWMSGPSRLGYGGDGEVTTISYGPNSASRYITAYFRKAFNLANPAAYDSFLLRLVRDDGAVVYLNGVEVYRNNLLPGPVSWNSLATATVNPPDESTPIDVVLSASRFVSGTNFLAVELHQVSTNSEDAGFNLALAGQNNTNLSSGVYLSSPADGGHFNSPANISLAAFAVAPAGVSLVEYFDSDTSLGQASTAPYSLTWNSAPIGTHYLTARATDSLGQQTTSAVVTVTVGLPPSGIQPLSHTLIPAGSTWRFWDNVTAVASGWQGLGFDDSGWPVGTARFGWGLDGEVTTLTSGRVTDYFRRWFTVTNPLLLTELTFQLARDDGAVVYLNGVEVFRSNMPAGTITASTLASSTVNTPDETTYFQTVLPLSGQSLNTGSNLVAVELHQGSVSSSDAGFDLQLLDYGTTEERVALVSPTNNQSLSASAPIPLTATAWGGGGVGISKVEFYADNIKLGEAAGAPYQIMWYDAPIGNHSLAAIVNNSNGSVATSGPVNVTVSYLLGSSVVIASNEVWKYLDDGSDQGTNWAQPSYDDSAWASSPLRLGFGGEGEEAVLSSGHVTYYFRHWFTVPNTVIITNFNYHLLRDDGAIGWLNGAEIFRSNMPTGAVNYLTTAVTNVPGVTYTFFPGTASAAALVPGQNLLAVEVHQSFAASADLAFNFQFDAVGYILPTPPLLTIDNLGGSIHLSWPLVSTNWNVYSSPDLSASSVWTQVTTSFLDTNGSRTVTLTPDIAPRFYRLQKP